MYTGFFGLNEKPFSITPDPRYLYMSERHAEALAHLIYGVKESGGFIQLTGEVGTGKTTLVRSLLQQLPDFADVAVVLNSQLSRVEFLTSICEELQVVLPEQRNSIKALTDALNAYLLQNHSQGRRTILIVDEAQNLRVDVLEQVRLLTNLETAKQKLLQIILIGQPELRELLARNDMRQLAQRITGRYHLEPLTREETGAYVDHRLKVAGAIGPIFLAGAKRELFRLSGGVPRMINVIADRALLGAFTIDEHQITPDLVKDAGAEVYDRPRHTFGGWWRRPWWAHPTGLLGLGAAGLLIVL
ncbi:MAG: AAA family ATPase, partial [Gammaproteobacteria bacterium]